MPARAFSAAVVGTAAIAGAQACHAVQVTAMTVTTSPRARERFTADIFACRSRAALEISQEPMHELQRTRTTAPVRRDSRSASAARSAAAASDGRAASGTGPPATAAASAST